MKFEFDQHEEVFLQALFQNLISLYLHFQKMNPSRDYKTDIFKNYHLLCNQSHKHCNFQEIVVAKKKSRIRKGRPLLVTKDQKLNNMRKDLIDSPNLSLGYTENGKNAANHHQFQEERYNWLKQSFGLCQLQPRKTILTAGSFLEYHGNWIVFIFS